MNRFLEIAFNALFWIIIFYLLTQLFSVEHVVEEELSNGTVIRKTIYNHGAVWRIGIGLLIKMAYYYGCIFFLLKKHQKQQAGNLVIRLVIFTFLFTALNILISFLVMGWTPSSAQNWFDSVLMLWIQYAVLSVVAYAHFTVLKSRKEALATQQLEKEKALAELQALKAQINPHFLFNALNNLLSITNKAGNDEASGIIVRLSEMMRFLLYDVAEKRIPLQKEIEFIEHFIEMNQLRFSETDDIKINFSFSEKCFPLLIEPALLIPFVENAFKHGIDIFKPSFIHINLSVDEQQKIDFQVANSIHKKQKAGFDNFDEPNGIGLTNVTKRLDIAYPEQYDLKISEAADQFSINLKLQL